MPNKNMGKAYKLTSENRHLATFFDGITIDEEKSILWSEQDLRSFGCEEVQADEQPKKLYSSDCVILACLLGYILLCRAIAVLEFLPSVQSESWSWTLRKRLESAYGSFLAQSPLGKYFSLLSPW